MKKLLLILAFSILSFSTNAETRFGDMTEMRDERMRGKDGKWVRPHPGPFIWNGIEKEQGVFNWEETDKYVVYAQKHSQHTLTSTQCQRIIIDIIVNTYPYLCIAS